MIRNITLGSTGITAPQNGFGALPIQRCSQAEAVHLLRKAYEGGMRFFDTARAYTDSEEKVSIAFEGMRDKVFIATKSGAKTGEDLKKDLETSLRLLKTDYIDIYQLHMAPQCYRPGDGTGLYEALLEAKAEGKIRHIGITAHLLTVAREAIESGLYETLQFPFSYLSSEQDLALVKGCKEKNMGFIAMKSLAGGLITNSRAAMAFTLGYDNVMPIWGIQKEQELDEWLSYMEDVPAMTDEIRTFIEKEKQELAGSFCRGCGYCLKECPMEIKINNCARTSLMIRRAPTDYWFSEEWQKEMEHTLDCIECRACEARCPYSLPIPELLKKNYEDYKQMLAKAR